MKASVIITTYNRPLFLKRALESCINQITDYTYEIIVVDDNGLGTDQQLETEKLIETYDNIIYIPLTKNAGACAARNIGVEKARGKYIFFLDDDDEFLPDKIEKQINFLKSNPNLDGCLAAFKRISPLGNEIIASSNFPIVGDFKNFVINGNFFTPMLCIKRNSFLKSGGFIDIPRFQDRFYLMNAIKKGYLFSEFNERLHIMYEHEEDRITVRGVDKTLIALNQIMEWLANYKNEFSNREYKELENKLLYQKAITYYVSNNKSMKVRVKTICLFVKHFLQTKQMKSASMTIKSLIK